MINVALYCAVSCGSEDLTYGNNGAVKHDIERMFGEKIELKSFGGDLRANNSLFVGACATADVVVLDLLDSLGSSKVMDVVESNLRKQNPKVLILRHTDGHEPGYNKISCWTDDRIIQALELARAKKQGEIAMLVVDDKISNLAAAREQFSQEVVTTSSYIKAIEILQTFKVHEVATDLMMPCEDANQGREGLEWVGKLEPMGIFVALKAVEVGAVAYVVSDTSHHDHPAAHAATLLKPNEKSIIWHTGCRMTSSHWSDNPVKNWTETIYR
jgi:CheY-like chemotaxis protein